MILSIEYWTTYYQRTFRLQIMGPLASSVFWFLVFFFPDLIRVAEIHFRIHAGNEWDVTWDSVSSFYTFLFLVSFVENTRKSNDTDQVFSTFPLHFWFLMYFIICTCCGNTVQIPSYELNEILAETMKLSYIIVYLLHSK